jgi:putative ABC transport system ATP-binding protein
VTVEARVFAVRPPSFVDGSRPEEPPTVVGLTEVVKEYAGSPPVRAVDGISFAVRRGEFLAIVGPSGSGKSTLLNLIGALDRPTSGTVQVAGHDIAGLGDADLSALRNRHIGFVFQQFNLIEGLTAVENVAIGLMYAGEPVRRRLSSARAALERIGLGHRIDQRPGKLSGGERQRVAIARAVVGEPSLVLADEPTGNLDSHTGAEIMGVFHDLHRTGSTIVLITHDATLSDALPRCVSLRDGRVVQDRAPTRAPQALVATQ